MKHITTIVFGLLLLLFPYADAGAEKKASTVYADASARIVAPVSIRRVNPLSFGFVTPGGKSGRVRINPSNNQRQFLDGTGRIWWLPGAYSRATFRVSGTKNHSYSVALPSTLLIRGNLGGPQVKVTNFQAFSENMGTAGPAGLLGRNGQDRLHVGGDLLLASGTFPGFYQSFFDVTVSYE